MNQAEMMMFLGLATLTSGVIGGEEAIKNRPAPKVIGRAVTENGIHNVVARSDFLDLLRGGKIVIVGNDDGTYTKGTLKTTNNVSYLVMEDGSRYVYNGKDYLKVQR